MISDEVGAYLAGLAKTVPEPFSIVELGSYKGKSTCYLAAGASNGVHVWAVDPWDLPGNPNGKHGYNKSRGTFDEQTRAFAHRITPVQGYSTSVARTWTGREVGLLFVDGSHEYEDVLNDFLAWEPHLAPDAIIAFDDYNTKRNPGVKQAVDQLIADGYLKDLHHGPAPLVHATYNQRRVMDTNPEDLQPEPEPQPEPEAEAQPGSVGEQAIG